MAGSDSVGMVGCPRIALALCAACTGPSGSLDLALQLPPSGDLRPVGMTTVGVTTVRADGTASVVTTALVNGMTFSAGDVHAGDPITLQVELRDPGTALVGYGEVDTAVTPSSTDHMSLPIPVRKPIVYVSSDHPVLAIDPTRDAVDPKYQTGLGGVGVIVVPIDGTELAMVTASGLQPIATATHMTTGQAIALSFGMPIDAAVVPGQRKVVVGTQNGLAVVDIDAGKVTTIATSRADRVAVGGSIANGFVAYVLSNRVTPPTGAGTPCMGTSTVLSVPIDGGAAMQTVVSGVPIADIAASGDAVFGANPCAGTVKRLDAGGSAMLPLTGAAQVAIQGNRVWAAGSMPPVTGANPLGARITLGSIRLDGGDPRQLQLPPKAEVVTYDMDAAHELSIALHADTEIPLDLAILPAAERVALIARMDTHRNARGDTFGKIIPEMQITVYDVFLADPVTGATTRIRASCQLMLIMNSDAQFPNWSCASPTESEAPTGGEFVPVGVDALFGAR